MQRAFRKYHRSLALIVTLPLVLTVLTGIVDTFVREWSLPLGVSHSLMMRIHTGEIFHLEKIYPILNGLGLFAMLVTGLSMTGLFGKKHRQPPATES